MSTSIQMLMQLFQCSRRSPKVATAIHKSSDEKPKGKATKACNLYEFADLSTDAISDHSGHTDSSSETQEVPNSPSFKITRPPGLATPPGLDAYAEQPHDAGFYRCSKYWDRVVTRPGPQHVRRAETRRSPGANGAGSNLSGRQPKGTASDPLVALKDALDRLAPNEIAAVKSLLDSKMRDDEDPGEISRSMFGTRQGARRAFTPFSGTRASTSRPEVKSRPIKPDTNDEGDSLRSFLHDLAAVDDVRVLSVRRINRLGFGSGPLLQTYFQKFGTVERVMVAPTLVKNKATIASGPRMRPACLGFVVMSKAEEATAALNQVDAHVVDGIDIGVFPFQSHSIDGTD